MSNHPEEHGLPPAPDAADLKSVIAQTISDVLRQQSAGSEPAFKTELLEERRRREGLEKRINELVQENERSKRLAEETERNAAIKAELQRLGVGKVDLAFRIVRDDIQRGPDGGLVARTTHGEKSLNEYLSSFVHENPEFLPARMSGGSGFLSGHRRQHSESSVDLDDLKPGLSKDEMNQFRREISRVAQEALRGN